MSVMFRRNRTRRWCVYSLLLVSLICTMVGLRTTGAPAAGKLTTLEIGIGFQSPGLMLDATLAYLQKTGLFEKVAKDLGYDLKVNWYVFPYAPEHLAAMHAGKVQIGTMATFPILRQIELGQPMHPLALSWGGLQYHIAVAADSPIKEFKDLKGKTIALPVGTALQGVFETFLLCELGKTAQELDIKYFNQNVPVPFLPRGVDATISWLPIWLPTLKDGNLKILAYLSRVPGGAQTGPAYDGYLGKGEGIPIPSVKKSPFYPEGYTALRHVMSVFGDLPVKHPNVVVAWLVAHQKAVKAISEMTPDEVMDMLPASTWENTSRDLYRKYMFGDEFLYDYRDWIWLTEGELEIMLAEQEIMKRMGVLEKGVTREQILAAIKPNIPLMERAYSILGKYPTLNVFTDPNAADKRGKPLWEIAK